LGEAQEARNDANAALKLARNRYIGEQVALALALAGDASPAEKLAAALSNSFPFDTVLQRYSLPTIYAALALQRGDAAKALDFLAPMRGREFAPFGLTPLGRWIRSPCEGRRI
jgi:hypothetical protein